MTGWIPIVISLIAFGVTVTVCMVDLEKAGQRILPSVECFRQFLVDLHGQ